MSITDELRKEARGFGSFAYTSQQAEHLTAIADRIDAEHEKECSEAWMRGHDAWAAIDRSDEMAEHGWIRLPKDADGEPVRIGDVMEWPTTGETFEVVGIGDGTLFYVKDGSEMADWTGASTKRHHKSPTVEDVLREFLEDWRASTMADGDDIIAKYATKLQLKEDA